MSQPRVPQLSVVMPSVVMLRVIAPSLRCASQLKNERVVKICLEFLISKIKSRL